MARLDHPEGFDAYYPGSDQGLGHRPWRVLAGTHGLSLAQVPSPADTWRCWVTATGSPTKHSWGCNGGSQAVASPP